VKGLVEAGMKVYTEIEDKRRDNANKEKYNDYSDYIES
jgi:hypothetical protein